MKIRKATIKDFKDLKEIKSEFFLWECKKNPRWDPKYAQRGLGIRLAKNLRQSNTVFLIAKDGNKTAGFAGAEIIGNSTIMKQRKQGHLFSLYVRKEYRKRGIARALLKQTLDWFGEKKISNLFLETNVQNRKAIALYKKYSYEESIVTMVKRGT